MTSMRVCYIGDSVTARGLALAGVETWEVEPEPQAVMQALTSARDRADLIILNQRHADVIASRHIAHEAVIPPVVVLPSMDGQDSLVDRVIGPARRVLGLS
jgi:vacuolar-type H+-ATPase subunit F/Vma7